MQQRTERERCMDEWMTSTAAVGATTRDNGDDVHRLCM